MAEELQEILEHVAMEARDADEISAHFLLIKAIDNTAFEADVTAFQVGLMISRAMPEHRAVFQSLCARYDTFLPLVWTFCVYRSIDSFLTAFQILRRNWTRR